MGNCQAIDAATLVIQHPSGKVDKFYWPVSAAEIMKMNPGHYVALLLSTTLYPTTKNAECPNTTTTVVVTPTTTTTNNNNSSVRITRIKLLKPTDTLLLGHVYRLITTQEVMKGLWEKKQAQKKKNKPESAEKPSPDVEVKRSQLEKHHRQVSKTERSRGKTTTATNSGSGSATAAAAAARSRTTWQPSLQSISEAVS
ncbi:hypothetical protein JCGZ_11515 [Jatropha curcas]|uniref:DUF4228 domain-containing protein n=1 Tax=Jatropha curcas TaxID=180498 RepID=A0A067KH33_JATCU|nr:uncharacterized protein LOC105640425 [Jatropha curcas]KDP31139.1 hypothetical protein JCGZ_11515 [Jatropha curcas]